MGNVTKQGSVISSIKETSELVKGFVGKHHRFLLKRKR